MVDNYINTQKTKKLFLLLRVLSVAVSSSKGHQQSLFVVELITFFSSSFFNQVPVTVVILELFMVSSEVENRENAQTQHLKLLL